MLILVIDASIDEQQKFYREYLVIKVDVYKKYGWLIEENLTHLHPK